VVPFWLILSPALALRPAPDVREEVESVLAAAVAGTPDPAAAHALAERVEDRVGVFAQVRYEAALAWNRAGELERARRGYDAVLETAPDHAAALYDRGEIALLQGNRAAARSDLEAAAALRPDHWVVYYRLAWLELDEGHTAAGEDRLLEALRRGMNLRMLVEDPGWHELLKRPDARRAIERMVVVYGSDALLKDLEALP
jgi:tetratricopeptide (TPR) repeat protein